VLDRNRGPIGEAEARRIEAAARFLALQATAIGELERALANREATREGLAGSAALLDAERERVRETEQALAAGATDRLALQMSLAELARAERLHVEAQARFQQAQGDVEVAVQAPLEPSTFLEQGRAPAVGVAMP
jgi:outer membrane protein TolC